MRTQQSTRIVIILGGLVVVTMACGLSTATPQSATPTATGQSAFAATQQASIASATPTPQSPQMTATALVAAVETLAAAANTTPTPGVTVEGGNGASNGNGGGNGNGGTNGRKGVPSPDPGASPTPTLEPTAPPEPYVVKQIETLGGEAISGNVCSVTQPFSVLSRTPRVTFTFIFVPQDAQHGKVSYTYSIPKAGESHDAAGTYSLSPVGKDGTLQLSLSVSDHVVFKGFDGNIPNRYKFNLVPSGNTGCPAAP